MTGIYDKPRVQLWTAEEEYELFAEYREKGSARAKEKIIVGLKPLVKASADKTQKRSPSVAWFEFEDLYQEALIGALMAIDRYDVDRGVRFALYARPWIEGRLSKFVLENCYGLKVNARFIKKMHDLNAQYREELAEAGESSEFVNLDPARLSAEHSNLISILNTTHVSVEAVQRRDGFTEDDSCVLQLKDERVDTELEVADKLEIEALYRAIETTPLTERERDIIRIRFQEEDSTRLREVGEKYGISTERARQIQNSAIRKIRKTYAENNTAPTE